MSKLEYILSISTALEKKKEKKKSVCCLKQGIPAMCVLVRLITGISEDMQPLP